MFDYILIYNLVFTFCLRLPTFQMKKKFEQTASTLKDVLSADLFLEAITELSLSSICIESGFRKLGERVND